MDKKKIVFVCQCNVCRSPMAEFIFKSMTAENNDAEITSAGLSGEKAGQDMTDGAKECLSAHGVKFENRQAAVFSAADYLKYDMIVCMDEWSRFNIKIRCLNDPLHKIFKLLEFSRSVEGMAEENAMLYTNVTDPYYSKEYEQTFSEICEGCAKLKERISDTKNLYQ